MSSIQMREITEEDYEEFLKKHKEVVFEDNVSGKRVVIKLEGRKFIPESELYPKDFELEGTTGLFLSEELGQLRENTNIMCMHLGGVHEDTKLFPHIRFKS